MHNASIDIDAEPGPTSSPVRTMRVLEVLVRRPASINELARLLRCYPATTKRIVAGLAAAGYVERVPGDDRRRRWRVAAVGRELGSRLSAAPQQPPDPPATIRGLPDPALDGAPWRAWLDDLERRSSGVN